MGDFEGALSNIASMALQDGIAKMVGGFQPDPTTTAGAAVLNGSVTYRKYVGWGIASYTSTATVQVDPTQANTITYQTSGAAQTNLYPLSVLAPSQPLNLVFYQGVSGASGTMVFGAPFKANGNLTTGLVAVNKAFTVSFVSDGTSYYETGRVANAM